MKSFMAKQDQVDSKWILIDADNEILGRVAVEAATALMGKNKPTYTPHVDTGDYVVIVNAEKIKVSGTKADYKFYDYYTGYPGGRKVVTFADMLEKHPERVVEMAVKRMLPKSKMGKAMLKKLKVYGGSEHCHVAQKPEKMEL